ncbi:173aa long hypothetical protein [Pyrococcus horikoshii OT3]|uniref:Uncharacterized protein n=1 Tax=Pyrococcus horikoshii (strain ATCC 700860 / DSM 12428 / JCM 9974 / NBRC 100139 / OT-3) TaxID=70601 RepID=O59389_PYRHO|nr:173aa long hypothetical protein [Pyrococcus horikoshii OT3]
MDKSKVYHPKTPIIKMPIKDSIIEATNLEVIFSLRKTTARREAIIGVDSVTGVATVELTKLIDFMKRYCPTIVPNREITNTRPISPSLNFLISLHILGKNGKPPRIPELILKAAIKTGGSLLTSQSVINMAIVHKSSATTTSRTPLALIPPDSLFSLKRRRTASIIKPAPRNR